MHEKLKYTNLLQNSNISIDFKPIKPIWLNLCKSKHAYKCNVK